MRILTSLFFVVFAMGTALAQPKGTNDISFRVGFGTSNEFLGLVQDLVSGDEFTHEKISPAFIAAYKAAVANNWFFYADGAYQTIQEDVQSNGLKIGDVSRRFITIGFGTEYHWLHKPVIQLYTGGSVAWTSQDNDFTGVSNIEDDRNSYFNFHINALGIRFGKAIAIMAEAGIGYKGYLNGGLSFQF